MTKADVLVLGGGPGGYLAAERAAQGGKSVILIEKRELGGTCLNEGCVPTKTLLNSAKRYAHILDGEAFGVYAQNPHLDHKAVLQRKNKVVKTLVSGVKATMKANGVTVIKGEGKIEGKTEDGFSVCIGNEHYSGENLILACGSVPVVPPITGLEKGLASGFVMTSREILEKEDLPERLAIIGGGVIGLEMASYFCTAGVQVTVIEMMDKIAGPMEREVSTQLLKEYQKKGMEFRLSCRVTEVTEDGVIYEENGEKKETKADAVLCAIGRRAAVKETGIENLGIYLERDAVVTDEHMQTNIAGVYAVGDINGKIMLAHTAYREAEVAVNHILGKKDYMRYNAIPSVIYTDPEVAGVGETEESAAAKGIETITVKTPMKFSGRYLAETENGNGFCKLIVDKKRKCLIGVHMIGSYASEIIYGAALMIEKEMPVDHIKELVFPHPTVSEIIREAVFQIKF